jgi:hypothetical protein
MNIHPLCYFDMSEQELQQMLQTEQETVDWTIFTYILLSWTNNLYIVDVANA